MIAPVWAAAVASGAIWLGVACNRRLVGWLPDDPPRPGRKQHQRPIPLAGILLLPAALPWLLTEQHWLLAVAAAIVAAIGFVDDRGKERGRDLGWRSKAIALLAAAALAATCLVDPLAAPGPWLLAFGLVFVLTNAINFLDNTDGVAAALAGTMLCCLGGDLGLAIGFAAFAFLPWNWPRPRLFLGDSGAYLLGLAAGTLTAAALLRDGASALWFAAVPLADFVQVMIARLWLAHPPWVGDRRHLTHVLTNLGLPRVWVAPIFAAIALGLAQLARVR